MVDKAMNISHLLTQVSKESFSASRSIGSRFPYGFNALGWVCTATTFAATNGAIAAPAAVTPVILWLVAARRCKNVALCFRDNENVDTRDEGFVKLFHGWWFLTGFWLN